MSSEPLDARSPGGDPEGDSSSGAELTRSGTRVDLRLTVDADEVREEVGKVTEALRARARLRGFRRGKAPKSMIRQRFRDQIKEHVLEHLMPRHVGEELKRHGLSPLHNPILDRVDFDFDGPLTFAVHFDVAPEFEITGYKGLTATRSMQAVTDDVVDQALGNLRERAAKLEPVEDEPASENDYIRVELSLFPRDGRGRRLAEEDRFVHLGNERAIPGLNSQLEGLRAGDTRQFVTQLGDAYPNELLAGKEVTCHVEVKEIKRRHLPAIDDELAKDLGLASLEELRNKTRDDLSSELEQRADREVERELLDQIIAANAIDVPESMLEEHLDHAVQRAAEDLAQQGIDPRHGIDWSSFRAENRPAARRAVQEKLLLDRLAGAEEIEVDDQAVIDQIEKSETARGVSAAAMAQQMRKDGSFEGLRRLLRRQRALDFVKDHATIDSVERAPSERPTSPTE